MGIVDWVTEWLGKRLNDLSGRSGLSWLLMLFSIVEMIPVLRWELAAHP